MMKVWQGIANQWDCDEMGHMNVRIYAEKALEGLGVLAHEIKMPHAFRAGAPSTLLPRDQHIRFLNEIHAGQPLRMQACVLEAGADEAVIYQDIRHADGRPAAAFRTRIKHVETGSGKPFAWSRRSLAALKALGGEPPDDTRPRSFDPNGPFLPSDEISCESAKASGACQIGLGAVPPQHLDVHGRMSGPRIIGRVSDSIPNLLQAWRKRLAGMAGAKRAGAAVLEYRLIYRRWPKAGDLIEVRSALGQASGKTHNLVHWILDPVSGRPWASAEAVAITFDLDTRKAIDPSPEMIEELKRLAPGNLAL